ncbi:MAG: prolipoprotein diacylglyceryl transferase [Alphaproteobacteria bacterium]|nr:prolipoprotein diacylglyceryl transferase [Alphaproteobacteria bacterium]
MTFAIAFPAIDPILVQFGPIAIRWYALAYIAGLFLGWRYVIWLAARWDSKLAREDIDDLLVYATLGVILGGRLGYVLFYNFGYYLANPAEVLYVWRGGMSFHGGLIGVLVALARFANKRGQPMLAIADLLAAATPIGLFFGRVANFINAELYGRPSDVAWAVIFPTGGPVPRHPSQLYEAALEGALLFVVLLLLARRKDVARRTGLLAGIFLILYALMRAFAEFFREPDWEVAVLGISITAGQLLSLPMFALGIAFVRHARRKVPT